MRRTTVTLLACSALVFASVAPGARALGVEELESVRAALTAARDMLDGEALEDVARRLEDVPEEEPLAWLARYYEGLAWYRVGRLELEDGGGRNARKALDRAANRLQESISLNPHASDSHALLGAAYSAQMRVTPWRDSFWRPKSDHALERALELNADNPRAWLLRGVRTLDAARNDREAADEALAHFARAAELFHEETPGGLPTPRWGESETWGFVALLRMDRGELDAARVALEVAGFANPDDRWITSRLQARLAERIARSNLPR